MIVHKHIIIRAEVAKPLTDKEETRRWIDELIEKIGMKKLAGPIVEYCEIPGNRGITSAAVIETSHIAMHVWDETDPGLLQLDVYSCSELPIDKVVEHIQVMEPVEIKYKVLDREKNLIVLQDFPGDNT